MLVVPVALFRVVSGHRAESINRPNPLPDDARILLGLGSGEFP